MLEKFIAREATPEHRLEILVARIACDYFDFNAARGTPRRDILNYLSFLRVWEKVPSLADERYSDLDREILGKLR